MCAQRIRAGLRDTVGVAPDVCKSPGRSDALHMGRYSAFLCDSSCASVCHRAQRQSSSAAEKRRKLEVHFPATKKKGPTSAKPNCWGSRAWGLFRGWKTAPKIAPRVGLKMAYGSLAQQPLVCLHAAFLAARTCLPRSLVLPMGTCLRAQARCSGASVVECVTPNAVLAHPM